MKSFQIIVSVLLLSNVLAVTIKKEHSNSVLQPNTFIATSQDAGSIIVDMGSGNIRVGFSGDDTPRSIFPSVIGTPLPAPRLGMGLKDKYIGEAALDPKMIDRLKIEYPINRDNKEPSWNGVESLLWSGFYERLRAEPPESRILLTGRLFNKKDHREKILRILFEELNVPALSFIHPAVAALYAAGKTTGVIVNIGAGDLSVTPVVNSVPLSHATITAPLGGGEVDQYLEQLLKKKGHEFKTILEKESVKKIKESFCYVDAGTGIDHAEKEYEVSPGRVIIVGRERWEAPEVLFKPSLIGVKSEGVHTLIHTAIMKADSKVRNDLFNNIVLTGGSTLFAGMGQRVLEDVRALAPPNVKVNVIASPERGSLSWIGASMTSTLDSFQESYFTKGQYDEEGPPGLEKFNYYKTA